MTRHDTGHERSDISARAVAWTAIGYTTLAALSLAGCALLLLLALSRSHPQSLEREPRREPPEPRLQLSPADDLATLRRWEEEMLHTYGWSDRATGRARIPIERAMEMIAEGAAP